MRPSLFTRPLPFHDALTRVLQAAAPVDRTEQVTLVDAVGRVASRDVASAIDVPPFDRASMDGYAVRSIDVAAAGPDAPVVLTCVDRILTGSAPTRPLRPGECAEIATGAPLPNGADAVVMVERTVRSGERISIGEAVPPGRNVGRRGSDIPIGRPAIRAGEIVTAARAGALAAAGQTTVAVFAKPTVAILSTGPEIAAPGTPLAPAQVYDVNGTTLHAIVREHGGIPVSMPAVGDSIDALVDALIRARASDVIVTSGGSSVGGRDVLPDALRQCGSTVFHGIAVKPGKPTLFGHVGSTPIFGMPGNPASCLSNAYILLVPFLRAMARLPRWQPVLRTVPLAEGINTLADRHQFYTVRIVGDRAEPAFKSSGDITSMAAADGYIEIPPGSKGLEAGDIVTVTMF